MKKRFGSRWWLVLLLGFVLGAGSVWAGETLFFLNWAPAVSPVEEDTLLIRHDAKGSGAFGAPRSGNRRHRGVDLEAPVGTPVCAIRSGQVLEIGRHKGLGLFVVLEHGHDLRSVYAHLDQTQVEVGQRVRQGRKIGTVGKTGNARHPSITPHLHLEVLRDGEPIDPATLGFVFVDPLHLSRRNATNVDANGGE